ncbi:hypothetical protein [Streptomyces sp. NBC_00576]|uniref:hypothetical protein n=1 Tax=Streptomyces sp. NBC_00576 TaxID=2903665 RepID=UPI002E8190BA|nr:hypothetical protein [Streptomyces sp. NBC_00576]WUB75561.1 hypothetical protein OG734_38970 [Streptomyces sp. NBC_00576]
MTTSLRPRRAGARTAALAALTLAGTTLIGAPAVAAPGDNGDVKIHKVGTRFDDQINEPKVCDFYLAAFNFDAGQDIEWSIETQPLEANGATLADTLELEPDGTGHTLTLALPYGRYKLTWNIVDGQGAAKHKVFQVDCATGTPTPPGGPGGGPGGSDGGPGGPGGPHGGVPAGGGGVARAEAFSPVAGAAAVGLIVVGGVVYLRTRRRADGAA